MSGPGGSAGTGDHVRLAGARRVREWADHPPRAHRSVERVRGERYGLRGRADRVHPRASSLRVRVGRGRNLAGACLAGHGHARRRYARHREPAHARRGLRRAGGRGRGAGDGHRDGWRREARAPPAAGCLPRARGRRTAGDHRVLERQYPPRDRRGARRQLQHDRRHVVSETGGRTVPRQPAAGRPGDAARVQRQHLHAGAAVRGTPRSASGLSSGSPPGAGRPCTMSS